MFPSNLHTIWKYFLHFGASVTCTKVVVLLNNKCLLPYMTSYGIILKIVTFLDILDIVLAGFILALTIQPQTKFVKSCQILSLRTYQCLVGTDTVYIFLFSLIYAKLLHFGGGLMVIPLILEAIFWLYTSAHQKWNRCGSNSFDIR